VSSSLTSSQESPTLSLPSSSKSLNTSVHTHQSLLECQDAETPVPEVCCSTC
jgi:hypothetical protein